MGITIIGCGDGTLIDVSARRAIASVSSVASTHERAHCVGASGDRGAVIEVGEGAFVDIRAGDTVPSVSEIACA